MAQVSVRPGDLVRVLNQRGSPVIGKFIESWPLRSGATCVILKRPTGGGTVAAATRHIEVLERASAAVT